MPLVEAGLSRRAAILSRKNVDASRRVAILSRSHPIRSRLSIFTKQKNGCL